MLQAVIDGMINDANYSFLILLSTWLFGGASLAVTIWVNKRR